MFSLKTATTGSVFCLETENVISAEANAITAGAIAEIRVGDGNGDGARTGSKLIDPYGNVWLICTSVKESE